jgi:hypothetical protein
MTTWEQLRSSIRIKANDIAGQRFSESEYLNAVNDAMVSFAVNHTPKMSSFDLEPNSSITVFDLPISMVEADRVYGVQYNSRWLEITDTFGGGIPSPELTFHIWPQNQIVFSYPPKSNYSLVVHCGVYYDEITTGTGNIEIPRWAAEPISMYAAARLLEAQSAKMALLGNFKQRTDSGSPVDNPLLEMAKHYMKSYWTILGQRSTPRTYGI